MTTAVHGLFGSDLSRNWALSFMRAAFLPVLAVLVLFGWDLSGVEALQVDQRAIYERFGSPAAYSARVCTSTRPGRSVTCVRLSRRCRRSRPFRLG